ncbi:hypothetical protein ACJX0J_021817, partial [Zea mays]
MGVVISTNIHSRALGAIFKEKTLTKRQIAKPLISYYSDGEIEQKWFHLGRKSKETFEYDCSTENIIVTAQRYNMLLIGMRARDNNKDKDIGIKCSSIYFLFIIIFSNYFLSWIYFYLIHLWAGWWGISQPRLDHLITQI